jgi:tetratricopeptide (TPR) repeat protein
MRALASASLWTRPWPRALGLAAALVASACATSGGTRPAPAAARDQRAFTVSERVRVGGGVRADFERAVGLLEQEQYAAAIALLVEVTEEAPRVTAAHINLGIAYGRAGDLERARASLEQAVALNSRHPVAHNELGIVYRRLGRFAEARQSYETALALYPDFHFARRNLAILCDLYLADAECALENYELYAKTAPGDETAAMWIADLRTRTGR